MSDQREPLPTPDTPEDHEPPLANGANGDPENHDSGGRFTKGNKAAVGRRTPRHVLTQRFRDIIACTPPGDFMEVWSSVIVAAKGPEPQPWAVKLFFELTVGNRLAAEQAQEIAELRAIVERIQSERASAN